MLCTSRPGMNEFDVQETIEHAYRTGGSRVTAFPTIAGAGVNSTVLHYRANERELADGDLMCVDSGAMYIIKIAQHPELYVFIRCAGNL